MKVPVESVKELRSRTGAGVIDCKAALDRAQGDMEKACEELKARGFATAEKKAHRETGQGIIECYVHTGQKVAAMVELNCETDFVARNEEFQQLGHDLAMQVAAMSPLHTSIKDVPEGTDIDPAAACLLQQPFIKDPSKTIEDLVRQVIAKTGENIRVRRFVRYELGS